MPKKEPATGKSRVIWMVSSLGDKEMKKPPQAKSEIWEKDISKYIHKLNP